MSRGQARRHRDERGLVLPTRLMVLSISAVALAGLGFVATQPGDRTETATPAAASQPKPTPSAAPTTTVPVVPQTPAPKPKPEIRRAKYYVVVFNNSNVKGLAGQTATRAQRAGWNVVGTDNWYGTVDASTVYYPDRLKAAGSLLAQDLGISRVKPAIAPMRPDRLTVILTGDYH